MNDRKLVEMCKIVEDKKSYEERQYLICYKAKKDADITDGWDIVIGRTNAYEYIKDIIDDIDLEYSFILVETLSLKDRKSIYAFMKHVSSLIYDQFDIDDYIKGDWDENDFKEINDIDFDENITNNRTDMKSIIDGDIIIKDII